MAKKGFKTEAEKQAWIEKKIEEKHAEREKKFQASGSSAGNITCRSCFHWATKSCPGLEPLDMIVCKYWYHPDDVVIGMAYCDQDMR